MINSRSLTDLHPKVGMKALALINECKKHGIDVLITSTYRDAESQNALYAQGRTTPGKKVTNAKGGQSYHNWRVAFDFVPIVHGKAQWDDIQLFTRVGNIGEKLGLEWAGRWIRFQELAHFQFTNGLLLADFQAGKSF
jgi:peptidoglycan LD-endopeptidase CwlK